MKISQIFFVNIFSFIGYHDGSAGRDAGPIILNRNFFSVTWSLYVREIFSFQWTIGRNAQKNSFLRKRSE